MPVLKEGNGSMRFSHHTIEQSYDLVITGQNKKNKWECFCSSGFPQRYSSLACPVKVCIWPFDLWCWEGKDLLRIPRRTAAPQAQTVLFGPCWFTVTLVWWSTKGTQFAALHPHNPSSCSPTFLQKCLQWVFPHDSNSVVITFSHRKTRKPTRPKLSELMRIPPRRPHSAPASCTSADYACACVPGLVP